jgi:protein ImuA
LVEWLSEHSGGGAGMLAMLAARHAAASGELIVVSDAARRFYPPAARALGVAAEQLVVVRPANRHDELWAIDQALRCAGVAAVLAWLQKFPAQEARRLQLAAESSGALGIFCRPAQARGQPSWANVQLLVEPQTAAVNRRLRVEVTRLRGGVAGSAVLLELDDITGQVRKASEQHDTHSLPAVPQLAVAAACRRQA